jgi:putative tricarboxylic transport membrane protein
VAPSEASEADIEALTTLVTEMHDSEGWAATLEERGWADAFLVGDEFQAFLEGNIAEVTETLKTIGLVAS